MTRYYLLFDEDTEAPWSPVFESLDEVFHYIHDQKHSIHAYIYKAPYYEDAIPWGKVESSSLVTSLYIYK